MRAEAQQSLRRTMKMVHLLTRKGFLDKKIIDRIVG